MKDIYSMLNDVEVDLSEYKEETLNDVEKARLKKTIRRRIPLSKKVKGKQYIVAASLLAGIVCMGFGGSVLASGNIMGYDLEYLLGIDRDSLADYKTVIDKTIVDNGIGIKLSEVILDGQALVIGTTIELEKPTKGNMVYASPKVYINGKNINRGSTGGSRKENDNTFVSTSNIYLHDTEIPEGDIDIKLVYNSVRIEGNPIKGKWVFKFKTNRDSLMADTKVMKVDKKIVIDKKQNVYVDNVQVTPLATTIEFKLNDRVYDIGFNMEDQDGNRIEVGSMSISRNSNKEFTGIARFKALDESVRKIKITPWYKSIPEESGRDSNDYTYMEDESFEIEIRQENDRAS